MHLWGLRCVKSALFRSTARCAGVPPSFSPVDIRLSTLHSSKDDPDLPSLKVSRPSLAKCCKLSPTGNAEAKKLPARRAHSLLHNSSGLQGQLYVVGTPIGNLEDLSFRALRLLQEASVVLAEDTRHTRRLFARHDIRNKLVSLHSYNEEARIQQVLEILAQGSMVALVSDAGMPAISDAGSVLVAAAIQAGYQVLPVPGPSASLAALVASGLPTAEFYFVGFLPAKSTGRQKRLQQLLDVQATLIFFAPARSLTEILLDMARELGGERQCAIARELTKVHEDIMRGSLQGLAGACSEHLVKGEITLIVQGRHAKDGKASQESLPSQLEYVQDLIRAGVSPSEAAKLVSKHLKCSKKPLYEFAVSLSAGGDKDSCG